MDCRKLYYSPNTFQSYGAAEVSRVADFLRSSAYDDGRVVEEFEARVASLFQMQHGILVNSGSSANLLAALALGIGPADEVITPACTFPTTLSPFIFLGARVVFCDIAPGRYVPSVAQVLALVTPRTTAIMVPDLVGDKFDFDGLRAALQRAGRSDVRLIEDACDTVTASSADIATVSFYASHVINAGGCGGMALTSDAALAARCRELRGGGAWDMTCPSYCAAFGLANSERIAHFVECRRRNLLHYCARLRGTRFYELPANTDAVWLSMPLVVASHRFEIVEELERMGVQTRLCMAGNILRQPFYARLFPDVDPEGFPVTERVFANGILIGLHQGLSDADIDWICDRLIELARKYGGDE